MHTDIHTQTYTHRHTYVRTYVRTYIHTYMHKHAQTQISGDTHIQTIHQQNQGIPISISHPLRGEWHWSWAKELNSSFKRTLWSAAPGRVLSMLLFKVMFATVCNHRPQLFAMRSLWLCLWGVLQECFWRLETLRNFVSGGRLGTSWQSDAFHTVMCQKSFCATGAILLHRFQKVVLRAFCESQSRAASSGANVSVILRGRGSIQRRSVVCGMSFCVVGAVFGTLYTLHSTLYTFLSTVHTLHLPLPTLTLHPTL